MLVTLGAQRVCKSYLYHNCYSRILDRELSNADMLIYKLKYSSTGGKI